MPKSMIHTLDLDRIDSSAFSQILFMASLPQWRRFQKLRDEEFENGYRRIRRYFKECQDNFVDPNEKALKNILDKIMIPKIEGNPAPQL